MTLDLLLKLLRCHLAALQSTAWPRPPRTVQRTCDLSGCGRHQRAYHGAGGHPAQARDGRVGR